ncbi:RagB/SusD family nutrient uptake outer membrane protein [Flavobacterium capsici]|uniref:RagB/SusD family nutrient uptake outer membrane protein n=1 Tax=Flavobacterium capsici TaxID=3075618 RepID=A0AA96EWZ0_9FLAO|nr:MULTISPECIES: RagB/SusD family nutrient uptake outer membrane protein [unclassified Flavobacterium]WNM19959.1 RagB/SusD family nutrient uptake outer membrane protein [Flavobacterium sp. PMR2A8]WNM21348.1 RagB/SusD family nutrient uptake outer membrane protein [Flavobacterium sp. PMTSA4]
MRKFKIASVGVLLMSIFACTSELDTQPKVEVSLEQLLNQDPNAIEGIMSKLYGSFALSGPNGAGSSDITDDPGESPFLRGIINLEEFTADGMKNRWGDDGLDQLTTASNWDENNKFFRYLYNRVYYTVPQCNNLLGILPNISISNQEQVVSEVRFLRSLAYFYMIDCFGKGVLLTEANNGQTSPAPQVSREELFNFVESELLAIENTLPQTNSYGRANKAVGRMLLAKLYLNAEVYTGTPRYNEALTFIKKVIDEGGYSLDPNFVHVFSGDNNTSSEIIYPLIADALSSQSFGNTTYIVNGSMGTETMNIGTFGCTEGWSGHRATKAWYSLFGDLNTTNDQRASLFWTTGHTYEMTDYKQWTNGYPSTKFRNSNFNSSSSPTQFSGTDFPLFRLADAYLIYAECVVRGATGGTMAEATNYVNLLRQRVNADVITQSQLTLGFIIDERGRELMFEGHRRTDLIRFGRFTGGTYLWPWKGNTLNGAAIPSTYNLFPIPLTALQANPNLTQNPGY